MANPLLVIDSNALRRLASGVVRARLRPNLRSTGRELWPTAVNVAEALKSRDHDIRAKLLRALHDLAGDNFAITLPTEALKRIAQAWATGEQDVDYSAP